MENYWKDLIKITLGVAASFIVCFILIFAFGYVTYNVVQALQSPEPTTQQQSCDHEWYELDYHLNDHGRAAYGLYCPKCKLEQEVEPEEWAKMKIDMEYEKENNND